MYSIVLSAVQPERSLHVLVDQNVITVPVRLGTHVACSSSRQAGSRQQARQPGMQCAVRLGRDCRPMMTATA